MIKVLLRYAERILDAEVLIMIRRMIAAAAVAALTSVLIPSASFALDAPQVEAGDAAPESATAAALSQCTKTKMEPLRNGAEASIPAATSLLVFSTRNCWLALDQNNYNLAVVALQSSLKLAEQKSISVDGYYGPATRSAILQLQYHYGVTADGEYGPQTGAVMRWKASNNTVSFWK